MVDRPGAGKTGTKASSCRPLPDGASPHDTGSLTIQRAAACDVPGWMHEACPMGKKKTAPKGGKESGALRRIESFGCLGNRGMRDFRRIVYRIQSLNTFFESLQQLRRSGDQAGIVDVAIHHGIALSHAESANSCFGWSAKYVAPAAHPRSWRMHLHCPSSQSTIHSHDQATSRCSSRIVARIGASTMSATMPSGASTHQSGERRGASIG